MAFSGLSGQYGAIPNNVWKEKYEITQGVIEPDEQVHSYLREQMIDRRPDAPFFESDQTRYDNHSEERISMRYNAHRTGEVPDAPDLFLELTERDPRGTSLGPNMRHLQRQSWSRAGYIKYYNDDDNSITTGEKAPQVLIKQLRDQFHNIKSRLKIFSTSRDNFASGKNFKFAGDSVVQNLENTYDPENPDGERKISYLTSQPRKDLIMLQSNQLPLGWESTSDLEYKVASYGHIRRPKGAVDAPLTIDQVEKETANLTTFQDQVVTTGLAQIMKQLSLEKARQNVRTQENMNYADRILATITPSKYAGVGQHDLAQTQSKISQDSVFKESEKMISHFIGQLNRQSGMSGQDIETQLSIITAMDAAMQNVGAVKKYQRQIETMVTQPKSAAPLEMKNTTKTKTADNRKAQNNTVETRAATVVKETGVKAKVANYGQSRSQIVKNQVQDLKQVAAQTAANKKGKTPVIVNPYVVDAKNQKYRGERAVREKFSRGLGSKYMADKIDTSSEKNAMAEMS